MRVVEGDRLVWYGEQADSQYWFDHWRARLTDGYLDGARRADLSTDAAGQLFTRHLPADASILEAGCGAGWWVAALQADGWDVQGIESAAPLVELVQRTDPDLPVRWGDALAIDADDGAYDAYLSVGVVEHRREGPEPFLAEARRVLRPGGVAVIAVPAFGPFRRLKGRLRRFGGPPGGQEFYQYGFRGRELAALMADEGFEVLEVGHYGAHRMLCEELPGYRWLTLQRGGLRIKSAVTRVVGRRDGHMVTVIGRRR